MWVRLDMSGVSPWFLLGLVVEANWPVVVAALLGAVVVGLLSRGPIQVIVLGISALAGVLVLAGLVSFAVS